LIVINGGPIDWRVLEISSIMVTVFSRATHFFVVVVTAKIYSNFLNFRPISKILREETLNWYTRKLFKVPDLPELKGSLRNKQLQNPLF
jgi:hypothetical protein